MTLKNAYKFSLEAVRQGRPSAAILACRWVPATREVALVSICEIKIALGKTRAQAPQEQLSHTAAPPTDFCSLTWYHKGTCRPKEISLCPGTREWAKYPKLRQRLWEQGLFPDLPMTHCAAAAHSQLAPFSRALSRRCSARVGTVRVYCTHTEVTSPVSFVTNGLYRYF